MKIKVNSEIGKLKKVLVHKPGLEVERVYPDIFERILFDDIMWVEQAQKDHDIFVGQLEENGVQVFYLEKLVAEIFKENEKLRVEFLKQFLEEAGIKNKAIYKASFDFFNKIKDNKKFVDALIAGIKKNEIKPEWDGIMDDHVKQHDEYPFYIDPIPNILFQRDPIASIFTGINIHSMTKATRRREGIFYTYLFKYHEEFKAVNKNHLQIDHKGAMEGGDVLVINKETLFVGMSERTTPDAIEALSKKLFKSYSALKRIVGIEIPKSRATMHLDTIITQMDHSKFSVDIDMNKLKYFIYIITSKQDKTNIEVQKNVKIIDILQKYIHPKSQLVVVGGGDYVAAKAEAWNDGANCLTLEPGTIFVYDRNVYTNRALEKAGVKLIKVPSGELGRGRGGPRCMTMPLEREDIE